MILETICVRPGQTNCYLAGDSETKDIFVIDPGGDARKILEKIARGGLKVSAILLTHGHFDHILAAKPLQDELEAPLCMGEKEAEFLTDGSKNLVSMMGLPYQPPRLDRVLREGDTVSAGGFTLNVLDTPGHTAGGVCYVGGVVFSGDTLFYESVGRTDFPTGDFSVLRRSLLKLAALPDSYEVYPGHGPATSIGHEKQCNPYLAGGDLV